MTGALQAGEGLIKPFGGIAALEDGQFHLEADAAHALCGEMSANKVAVISGYEDAPRQCLKWAPAKAGLAQQIGLSGPGKWKLGASLPWS